MPDSVPAASVVGVFADRAAARAAVAALTDGGVATEGITVARGAEDVRVPVMGRAGERERGFLWRLAVIVALWSIVGTGVGVGMGAAFGARGIGPQGVSGLLIQTVSWAIFAHLIAGLWAGYALLSNRQRPTTDAAAPHKGGPVVVRVACGDGTLAAIEARLRACGATAVGRYDADGRQIV